MRQSHCLSTAKMYGRYTGKLQQFMCNNDEPETDNERQRSVIQATLAAEEKCE